MWFWNTCSNGACTFWWNAPPEVQVSQLHFPAMGVDKIEMLWQEKTFPCNLMYLSGIKRHNSQFWVTFQMNILWHFACNEHKTKLMFDSHILCINYRHDFHHLIGSSFYFSALVESLVNIRTRFIEENSVLFCEFILASINNLQIQLIILSRTLSFSSGISYKIS